MNTYPPRFRNGGTFFMPDGGHHGGASTLAWVIFALQLLMLAALALLIVRAYSFRRRVRFSRHGPPPVEEILRHRYARGEISREEYLQASSDLGTPAQAPLPAEDAPTAGL